MDQSQTDEFDKAFAEIAAEKAGTQIPADPAPTPEPAPAPVSQEAAPAPEAQSLDQVQAQLRDMAHRERSASSRISAFARENNQLKAMLEELKRKAGAPAAPGPAQPQAEPDVLSNAPDLESAVRRRLDAVIEPLRKRLDETATRADAADRSAAETRRIVEPISRKSADEQIASTHNALDEQFTPGWRDDIRSAEFSAWLPTQPTWVQGLYENGVTPEDSATVLGRFYASGRRPKPIAAPATPAPTPAAVQNTAGQDPQQRLRSAAGIAPRGNARPATGPAEDDFQGNFEAAFKALKRA